MAGVKIVDLPALGRDLINTDLLEVSLNGGGSRKITGQEIMNASKLAIGSTPIVSGTVGRLLFQGTGDVLQQSSSLFWDNTNGRLGIGTSTPTTKINIVTPNNGDALRLEVPSTNSTVYDFYLGNSGTTSYIRANPVILEFRRQGTPSTIRTVGGVLNDLALQASGGITFTTYDTNERMRIIGSTGNVLIGTTTDAGFLLDVNGTARVSGALTASSLINIVSGSTTLDRDGVFLRVHGTSGIKLTTWNAGYVDALTVQATTGNVGIGTSSPLVSLDVRTSANSPITPLATAPNTATTFLVGNTGTNGVLALGQNNAGQAWLQGRSRLGDGSSQPILLNPLGGNILIGTTTDAGYKLDVNGAVRTKGNFFVGTTGSQASLYFENSSGVAGWQVYYASSDLFFRKSASNQFTLYDNQGVFVALKLQIGSFVGFASAQTLRVGGSFAATSTGIVGSDTQDASSQFEVVSTTKGFLPPRMTNAQRAAIASPAVGLIVYCTDATEGLYVYKSTGWTFMV